jgi:tryptophanyl-tRNA synthetase
MFSDRILSGMRVTGKLHLGHYHGVLKNWVQLQYEYECLFMIADWHGLTTSYDDVTNISAQTREMLIDWLASGVDPAQSTIFIQSAIPEHAELTLLLGMVTPLSWLERIPTYRDQIEKLSHKDLDTYGFLGYPLMQAADILLYRATKVPVGEDQVSHIEVSREIARRFNYIYGRELGFEVKAQEAIKKLGHKKSRLYEDFLTSYQQDGDDEALDAARALLNDTQNLSIGDKERLFAYLENKAKVILPEPEACLTPNSKVPGLDGQKMSKSYGNTISLREDSESLKKKIRSMPTDPARVRRTDPGEPSRCPVWKLHEIYTDNALRADLSDGCQSARIGCLDCKQPLIDAIMAEQEILAEKAQPYLDDLTLVRAIAADGCEKARKFAQATMKEVRDAMGLNYL